MLPTLYLEPETVEINGKLILVVHVPSHESPVQYKMRTFDRAEDGDIDFSRNWGLLNALFERKATSRTERKLCPLVKESDLRLGELMPKVRQMAVNKRAMNREEDHPCVRRVDNLDRYDDRLMVTCNLIEAFDKIMGFISKHTLDRFFVVDGQRTSVQGHIAFEIVSNILSHQEFASTMPARVLIERDRLVTENWNRPLQSGPIDPHHFKPDPKNPVIAKVFVQIGYADTLGSGVRNLYKYTRIYSGQDPQLIDGDIFTTIIPMARPDGTSNVSIGVGSGSDDVRVDDGMGDSARLARQALRDHPTLTAAQLATSIGVTERQVRRILAQLRERGLIRREGSDRYGRWVVADE